LSTWAASCYGISAAEAVFRCQASINQSAEIAKNLNNSALANVARVALAQMQKLLDTLSNNHPPKDLPIVAMLCIKHAEHIAWLKDSIAPNLAKDKAEAKIEAKSVTAKSRPETAKQSQAKNKKLPKKANLKRKKINIKQREFDTQTLEEMLKKEVKPHSKLQKKLASAL